MNKELKGLYGLFLMPREKLIKEHLALSKSWWYYDLEDYHNKIDNAFDEDERSTIKYNGVGYQGVTLAYAESEFSELQAQLDLFSAGNE